jgi:lipopolysaccharide transport system permease protein
MGTVIRSYEPPLARPAEFAAGAWRDLRHSYPLALEIAKRDLRRQYRHSLLGPTAVLLLPLALTVLALGFHRSGILQVESVNVPYALYVLAGVILWITFVEALNAPVSGLVSELRVLTRTTAPPEAIVLGKLGPIVFNLLVKLLLLAVGFYWYRIPVHAAALLAGIGIIGLFVLGTAIGLVIAPLNLLYNDISWILGTATTVWFFFSPVYFPVSAAGPVGMMMRLNPITPLLADTRSLLLTGVAVTPVRSALILLAAFLLLVFSWFYARIVFRVAMEQLND